MGRPIDSQDLREAMYHEAFETDSDEQMWDSGCWIRYKMFERILNSMPAAQPERKRGKWIDGYCSVCGCDVPAYIEDWRWVKDMKARFCPMCGADMRTPTQEQLDEADDVMMGGNDETD